VQRSSSRQQNAQTQQIKTCPTIHLPFDKFQPVHMAFGSTIAPRLPNSFIYRRTISFASIDAATNLLHSVVTSGNVTLNGVT